MPDDWLARIYGFSPVLFFCPLTGNIGQFLCPIETANTAKPLSAHPRIGPRWIEISRRLFHLSELNWSASGLPRAQRSISAFVWHNGWGFVILFTEREYRPMNEMDVTDVENVLKRIRAQADVEDIRITL